MDQTVSAVVAALGVEPLGGDRFGVSGASPLARETLFGGALLFQALLSADATVPDDYAVHHLHGEFPQRGRAGEPIVLAVDRVKDGRSLISRRVVGRQGDRVVVTLEASFQRTREAGAEFQLPSPLRFPAAAVEAGKLRVHRDGGFGIEFVDATGSANGTLSTEVQAWYRAADRLPGESVWHAGVLTLVSDMAVPTVAITAAGLSAGGPDGEGGPGTVATTSVNHTMWFHRPLLADEWFVLTSQPLSTAHGRGVALGSAYDGEGRHVASIVQEIYLK
ncbi:acyl-CoA thioesterase [Trujillonella endophytica]|uniref:Acyl-CoA thioesterase-2 n=1 Tax=Trujillonella endophytica TaxID=673521 RepID=A0A1H8VRY1_9ACTN|nr:acyl-CoA thioesterase domain-containing protein [Trujillella endophytica]SEP18172.1 acyl-CoA thioesterase-2 [Trujillella endophytica]